MLGLVGKKIGMTRIFNNEGISIPVSIINIESHYITNIREMLYKSYYGTVQVTTCKDIVRNIKKAEQGIFKNLGIPLGIGLWEFKVYKKPTLKVGDILNLTFFKDIKKVDITGYSKGKGFSGTIKRWNFSSQDATHGNSLSHRAPGSIGQNQSPGRVLKGKKMAGHLGNERTTIHNLQVIKIDFINNIILIKGSIPGFNSSLVIVRPAIKI